MTLTEQWKKGELKEGWYYIECIDLPKRWIDIDYYRNDCYEDEGFCKGFFDHNDWRGIDKLLAPVPSYEEYSRLEWYAGCGPDRIVELNKENQHLKELLKECSYIIEGAYMYNGMAVSVRDTIITKIDKVLK